MIQGTWSKFISQLRDFQRREVMNENKNNDKRDKSEVSYTVLVFYWMIVFCLNSKWQASFNAFGRRSFAERRSNEMRYWKWSCQLFVCLIFHLFFDFLKYKWSMSNVFLKFTCLLRPAEICVVEIFHSLYFISVLF